MCMSLHAELRVAAQISIAGFHKLQHMCCFDSHSQNTSPIIGQVGIVNKGMAVRISTPLAMRRDAGLMDAGCH